MLQESLTSDLMFLFFQLFSFAILKQIYSPTDIDECNEVENACPKETKCKNVIGDYECVCADRLVQVGELCVVPYLVPKYDTKDNFYAIINLIASILSKLFHF